MNVRLLIDGIVRQTTALLAQVHAVAASEDLRAVANVAWLRIFLGDERTEDALAAYLNLDVELVRGAVRLLEADGRVRREDDGLLLAENVVIPVGASEGWEAAILDHFRAVATAIAFKAAAGAQSTPTDEIGGTTLSFSVYPGHPFDEEVRGLLGSVRSRIHELWTKASAHNAEHPVPENATQVLFYVGQLVTDAEADGPDEKRSSPIEPMTPNPPRTP
jgi:hypothetical protein